MWIYKIRLAFKFCYLVAAQSQRPKIDSTQLEWLSTVRSVDNDILAAPFNIVRQKNPFSVTQVCWLVWRCTPNFRPAARPLPAAPPPGGGILHSHKRQHYYANNMLCQLGRGGGGSRQYQGIQFMYDCQILQLQSYVQSLANKANARKMVQTMCWRVSWWGSLQGPAS